MLNSSLDTTHLLSNFFLRTRSTWQQKLQCWDVHYMTIRWTLTEPTTSRQNNCCFFHKARLLLEAKHQLRFSAMLLFQGTNSHPNQATKSFICKEHTLSFPLVSTHSTTSMLRLLMTCIIQLGFTSVIFLQKNSVQINQEAEDSTPSSYKAKSMQARALPADLFTLPGKPFPSPPYVAFQCTNTCQGFSWTLVSLPDRLQGTTSSA